MNIYCFSTLSFAKLQFKSVINKAFHKHGVASFTDAWIETLLITYRQASRQVASFTDAWIETMLAAGYDGAAASHLLQMRGLKLLLSGKANFDKVASFTDAWIETPTAQTGATTGIVASFTDAWIETLFNCKSHYQSSSHLLQMRGLKQKTGFDTLKGSLVASFTDAWIETTYTICPVVPPSVASFTDAWIETKEWQRELLPKGVASFTDAWIETFRIDAISAKRRGRIFYRCVD